MNLHFTILGAGNGGQSLAGDLILRGFQVEAIYDRYPEMIEPIVEKDGITLVGKILEGFAPVNLATTDLQKAIDVADVLWVVVPAFAHEYIATAAAPYLRDGQLIVLCPGYLGGTLAFRETLKKAGCQAEVQLAETMILPYATRIVGPATVGVRAVKKWVEISAFPATNTARVVQTLQKAMPQFAPGPNILATGLNNPNPIMHVATALLNTGRFETSEAAGGFDFHEWISPSIARINDLIDKERLAVVKKFGFDRISLSEFDQKSYDQAKQVIQPQGPIPKGSGSVPPRYVIEDVPMGLVPLSQLARVAGVPTPTIDTMINLACLVHQENYWQEGRTLQRLGLEGLSIPQIITFVETGQPV
ncbi:MAG: NAD/NADP octopine/nopaline dehydrogenase family protein [Promethearchaeota archaeon]